MSLMGRAGSGPCFAAMRARLRHDGAVRHRRFVYDDSQASSLAVRCAPVGSAIAVAASAAADPIVGTTGTFQLNRQNDASLRLNGVRLQVFATLGSDTPGYAPATGCFF